MLAKRKFVNALKGSMPFLTFRLYSYVIVFLQLFDEKVFVTFRTICNIFTICTTCYYPVIYISVINLLFMQLITIL